MELKLVREVETDKSTTGKLYVDGKFQCFTLEDVDRKLEKDGKKVYGKTAIPRGTYDVTITMSNRFKKPLPLLANVPQFEGIRIHAGNTAEDTEGCILVGTTVAKDFVGTSRFAFDTLMVLIYRALERKEKVTITIV